MARRYRRGASRRRREYSPARASFELGCAGDESRASAQPRRGAHQVALTVRATVSRDGPEELRARRTAMDDRATAPRRSRSARSTAVHFARLAAARGRRRPRRAHDPREPGLHGRARRAAATRHVEQLADLGGAGLDARSGSARAIPHAGHARAGPARDAIPSQANYVNTVGRTVEQIRREEELRERDRGVPRRQPRRAARDARGRSARRSSASCAASRGSRGRAGGRRGAQPRAGAPARRCTSP